VREPCAHSNFAVSHASVCCARSETSLPRFCAFDWWSQHRHGRRGIVFLCSATHGHALRKVCPRYHRLYKIRGTFGKGRKIKHLILVLGLALCSHLVFHFVARDSWISNQVQRRSGEIQKTVSKSIKLPRDNLAINRRMQRRLLTTAGLLSNKQAPSQ
jgi:hypothetical protein